MVFFLLAGVIGGCAPEPPAQSDEEAMAEIWAIEEGIYAGRADGDLSKYLASASPHYMGWPPGAKVPADLSMLRQMAGSVSGQDQEELELEFADFTRSGDTAIVYYHTHRTRLPTGEPVNQRFRDHSCLCPRGRRLATGWRAGAVEARKRVPLATGEIGPPSGGIDTIDQLEARQSVGQRCR